MTKQYQGKNVRSVREAQEGDPGYQKDVADQVVVTLDDGTEKVVKRSELQDK